ncbi:MAG: hypothetical protein Tsb0021_13010 [Chlamydiales bacterium]
MKEDLNTLRKKKRELEIIRDHLWEELRYVDELMRKLGFSNGLESVKATARELSRFKEPKNQEDEAA